MKTTDLGYGVSVTSKISIKNTKEIFTKEVLQLISSAHRELNSTRSVLLKSREARQDIFDLGVLPDYLDKNSSAVSGDWKVGEIPKDYQKRRVEITGPVNDPKMVINMLSRNAAGDRADTAMVDFEDSMKPSFENVLSGYRNVIGAAHGTLSYTQAATDKKEMKTYNLDTSDMAGLMVRVRGLHLDESNILVDDEPVHGGLIDLIVCFVNTAKTLIAQGKTPKFYIPKCEHYLEARYWNNLFNMTEKACGLEIGTLKCTFLIETLPAAYQIEEILFEIKDHAIGLNVGRWDKIFSDIKVLKNHPDRISADRSQINMSKYWMENYAKRLTKICHSRGAMAIGGMSAFTPGKDPAVRADQTEKVYADKKNEFGLGHDGCWVSHPYFITMALKAFTKDNQLDVMLEEFDKYPNLIMEGSTHQTLEGLKVNVRVGIAYMHGWNQDIGCVAWDNLMEDLATLEISRAQTWQWLRHKITLTTGEVMSKDLVKTVFNEELDKIKVEFKEAYPKTNLTDLFAEYDKAAKDSQKLFLKPKLQDFLVTASDLK
jgi:malate synthase